ncbi:YeiH family protein [Humitalea sp. 24SJ18S-53]|uniref:YeiH family protein n=1 Tax=Humitalea sp. 24SJ18S-53 TaxID=3422307 RepID=UPI003D6767E5
MAMPAGATLTSPLDRLRAIAPGLLVAFAIAAVAIVIRRASGLAALNPVVVALVIGIAVRAAMGAPAAWRPGIAYAVRPVLRFAIVLLGLQVTLTELLGIGAPALALAFVVVAATLPFTMWLGRVMGVDHTLSLLIGTGTAICGASAIVAANQVAKGRDEDVAYALAVITLCGTAALLIWPMLAAPLGLSPLGYGIWAGASIHEVVQAVGAAAAGGTEAAQSGTVMKLARVFLLAPAVLVLGWWVARGGTAGDAKVATPWFAFGFLGLVLLGSTGLLPPEAREASRAVVPWLLAASVAGLGLSTDLRALRARGAAPLMLGVLSTVFIAALAWAGVRLIGI